MLEQFLIFLRRDDVDPFLVYRSIEVSDDGQYIIVYTYEIINEEFIYFATLKESLESNFEQKLKLVPINTDPASFTVNLL